MREDDGIRFRHMVDAAREAVEFSQFPQVRNLRHVKRKKSEIHNPSGSSLFIYSLFFKTGVR